MTFDPFPSPEELLSMTMSNCGQSKPVTRCSLAITAYNEAANIGHLLRSLMAQRLSSVSVTEIFVIISGCTDGTEATVRHFAAQDSRIRVLMQAKREGKAAAVNLFLSEATEKILVLCSADLILKEDTIEQLLAPFSEPVVGIATCRPVPVNPLDKFMGFAAHLLWDLHHQINLTGFKAGEVIAFRKIFEQIPYRTATDEASIEPIIRSQGYVARYVPMATVYNKGPETAAEFIRQRRRIFSGHLAIREAVGYSVSTMKHGRVVGLLARNIRWRPKWLFWAARVAILEAYSRLLGWYDFSRRRDHAKWEIAASTKQLGPLLAEQAKAAGVGNQSDSNPH